MSTHTPRKSAEEVADRLQEIQQEILERVNEAKALLRPFPAAYNRASAYWIPHIITALTHDHEYLGRDMCALEDTLEELENGENTEEARP
ncbi:MAG: hypothetical protein HY548_09380 [Elusimicrobia bacterium]|nr:hypothetical protein [Elusimicrobiota bacterium]